MTASKKSSDSEKKKTAPGPNDPGEPPSPEAQEESKEKREEACEKLNEEEFPEQCPPSKNL